MQDVVWTGSNSVTRARSEDNTFYVQTVFDDDAQLERNQQLAHEDFITKAVLGLHDNADIRAWISCPSTYQWSIFCKQNPGTYKLLKSRHETDRIKAIRAIYRKHPEWFIQART